MESSGPVVNGDLYADAQSTPVQHLVTPDETSEKMKLLIKENTDLQEILEELSVWRERQKGVIEFLDGKLEEAKEHISALTRENLELQRLKESDGGTQDEARRIEVDTLDTQVQVEKLSRDLQQVRSDLEISQSTNKTLTDRAMEQEKRQQEMEQQEKLQQEVLQSHRRVEELQKSLAQLQEAYIQLSDENCRMKEEVEKKKGEISKEEVTALLTKLEAAEKALADKQEKMDGMKQEIFRKEKELETIPVFQAQDEARRRKVDTLNTISKEEVNALQTRLEAAEKALADKQEKMDGMKQEILRKEKELETIPVFQAQAEVYLLDFNAERAAREKIHEENERLCNELESVKAENRRLQEELDALARPQKAAGGKARCVIL